MTVNADSVSFDLEFVRRDLLELLPKFAHVYGLAPWDLEQLTGDEVVAFLSDMRERDAAAAKEQAQAQAQLRELEAMQGR